MIRQAFRDDDPKYAVTATTTMEARGEVKTLAAEAVSRRLTAPCRGVSRRPRGLTGNAHHVEFGPPELMRPVVDGRRIAFTAVSLHSSSKSAVWVMENFLPKPGAVR